MDIGNAIGFVFEDDGWVNKVLLGAVISLIPFFGQFALAGYVIAVIRNVMNDDPRPLPDWSDIGQYFMDGIMISLANLVYALPFLIIACPMFLVFFVPAFAESNEQVLEVLMGFSGIVALALGCVLILYALALVLVRPVLKIKYAESGSLGACLHFGEVFRFTLDNIGSLIISVLAVWAADMVIGVIGGVISTIIGVLSIIPICGWILGFFIALPILPLMIWMLAFSGHLYGQVGRQSAPSARRRYPPTGRGRPPIRGYR